MLLPSQLPRCERLMVMLRSDTKAVYFTALLELHLGPLEVAERVFSGTKTRQMVFSIGTNPNSAVLAEGV